MKNHVYWNFTADPFCTSPDVRRFYESAQHEEALARLHFLVENHRRLGLLAGPSGTGKSLVLDVFAARLRRAGAHVAMVNLLGLGAHELLWRLAGEFGLAPPRAASPMRLWQDLADLFREHRYERRNTVLLLDDADAADAETLLTVTRLAQSDPQPEARVTLALATGVNSAPHLGRRLLELCDLRIELAPWDEAETARYVRDALEAVSGDRQLFTPAALLRLHDLTGGVPRRINRLAQLALLAGAAQQAGQIDSDTIDAVHDELDVSPGCLLP